MIIMCEELKESNYKCYIKLSGIKLPKMDFGLFAKSDPYFQVIRKSGGGEVKVYQSETISKSLNPRWKAVTLRLADMCNGDENRPIIFRVYDQDKVGKDDLIGEFEAKIAEIKQGMQFHLRRPKKKKEKSYGQIELTEFKIFREAQFLDYVTGGMSVNVMFAIDYTGSNRNPTDPYSLHYRFGSRPSPYADAIMRITQILAPYDKDQSIPVYGFGARLKSTNRVSHCFPINFNSNDPNVHGLEGILNAYNNSFNHLLLSGPTYFSEVLQLAAAIAGSHAFTNNSQSYSVLVILTDGVIDDMRQAIQSIVNMASLPISIVIVGVGDADFEAMNRLDGDDGMLKSSNGQTAQRDIVQFVPLRKFSSNPYGLTDEVLAEIPTQMIQFAKRKKVSPMERKTRQWEDVDAIEAEIDDHQTQFVSQQKVGYNTTELKQYQKPLSSQNTVPIVTPNVYNRASPSAYHAAGPPQLHQSPSPWFAQAAAISQPLASTFQSGYQYQPQPQYQQQQQQQQWNEGPSHQVIAQMQQVHISQPYQQSGPVPQHNADGSPPPGYFQPSPPPG
mmetsp:Transcript_9255/g.12901  ORF Transcript_9255/g.12901 Transcript_9255/m.12901 type:complete len:558 (-) Transcript_9255:170-1843(-)